MSLIEDELEMVRPSRRPLLKPFPFFDLPTELRLRIYEMLLVSPERAVNMDVNNSRLIAPRMNCFRASRQMFEEAYRVFYGSNIFRLYGDPEGKFYQKKPLLQRLVPRYRNVITTMDLRLGPGWTNPPKVQNTEKSLGLEDCTSLRSLRIMVEIDPSDQFYVGFRGKDKDETWYIFWCVRLLAGIMEQVPTLKTVELDAFPHIRKDAPIIIAIASEVERSKRKLVWRLVRGRHEKSDFGPIGLESAMAAMRL